MAAPKQQLLLNRYRLLENRAHGGFAHVDIAWDTNLDRRVALKRIPLQVSEDDLSAIEEARTAALLTQSNEIVTIYDFQTTGTEAIIAMQYVDGPNLAELMVSQEELLDLDTIAAILSSIAKALKYAHENQVLHLDIKPANILIDHQGKAKVSDFGLASLSSIAGFGEAQGGTIGYMAPEQLRGEAVDERTDLWAFAALAYQLICGRNPFFAETFEESLDLTLNTLTPLPSTLRPQLNPDIDDVLLGALNINMDDRPAKVRIFWRALAPYLGNIQTGSKKLLALVLSLDAIEDPAAETLAAAARAQAQESAGLATGELAGYAADEFAPQKNRSRQGKLALADKPPPPRLPSVPFWDRLSPRLRGFTTRILAALACGSSAWMAASSLAWANNAGSLPGTDQMVQAANSTAEGATSVLEAVLPVSADLGSFFVIQLFVALLAATAGLLAPSLGAALVVVALASSCFIAGYPLLGVAVTLGLTAWWITCGRRSVADAVILALTPLAGTLALPFLLPLLAGAFLPWRRALGTTLAATLLLAVLSVITAPAGSLGLLLPLHASLDFINPGVLGTAFDVALYKPYALAFANAAVWPALLTAWLGALASAFVCKRATRAACVTGSLLATAIMLAGTILPKLLLEPNIAFATTVATAISLTVSCGLTCLLALSGIVLADSKDR